MKIIKDEKGTPLAKVFEDGKRLRVFRTPQCSIGMYFLILSFLRDLGYEVQ